MTLFWDEVAILWDKNLFSIDGDLKRPLGQNLGKLISLVKFIYSEKATKFCEISTADLSYVVMVKSTVEVSQNFVAF